MRQGELQAQAETCERGKGSLGDQAQAETTTTTYCRGFVTGDGLSRTLTLVTLMAVIVQADFQRGMNLNFDSRKCG